MTYPLDGLPRFKFTGRNILDRANCHRIVKTWETPAAGAGVSSVSMNAYARIAGPLLCAKLNADPRYCP